ncbi:MAG TPA: 3-oxoacyl-ACP reductase family protein [Opitutaceae bacterium]|nr:3-oxoacyl-ACP reductase family protein [Opitutaceae bacterium]
MRLSGKTVLVTGGSTGIGYALALGCAREGADLIINYFDDRARAETVVKEITALGRRAIALKADIRKVREIDAMFARARKVFPRLDVLINNAGLTGWANFFDTTEDKWDVVLDTNLKGTFFCSLAAAKWMRDTKTPGSLINISTQCAELAVKNLVAYGTSKAGIHGLTKQLAVELAPLGIRVNTFSPGPVNVERNLADDPDYRNAWGSMVPLGRTAEPEEMVGPALFLASNDSSYVTGQTLFVDGGWTVQGKVPESNVSKAAKKNR